MNAYDPRTERTPGDWQLARLNLDTCTVDIETVERGDDVPTQGYTIAKVYTGPTYAGGNAHLLAAAPVLQDACRQALRYFIHHPHGQEWEGPEPAALLAALGKASGIN